MAFFAIDKMMPFVLSAGPVWCKEILHARPPALNGILKNRLHHMMKSRDSGGGEATGDDTGIKPGAKKNLIGINIPDAGDDLLMHQQRL